MYTRHRTQPSFRLPERLAEDTKLSSYAKQLALIMFSYAGQRTGRLRKSQRELAKLSGLSLDTVNRKLRELEKARYLTVRRKRAKRDRETGKITRGASEYICMVPKKGYLLVPYRLLRRLCGLGVHGASVKVFLYVYRIMRDECAYPSFSKIRKRTGLADSTVRSVLKVLDCVGLLYIRHCRKRNGAFTSNSYLLLHDAGYVCRPTQQAAPKPAAQRPCPNDRVYADIQNNKEKPKITGVLTREERIYRASILWDSVMMKIKKAAPDWHRPVKPRTGYFFG